MPLACARVTTLVLALVLHHVVGVEVELLQRCLVSEDGAVVKRSLFEETEDRRRRSMIVSYVMHEVKETGKRGTMM